MLSISALLLRSRDSLRELRQAESDVLGGEELKVLQPGEHLCEWLSSRMGEDG